MAQCPTMKLYKGKDKVVVNVPIPPANESDKDAKALFEENSKTVAQWKSRGFKEGAEE